MKESVYEKLPGALLPWYAKEKRDLPFRKDRDAYHVWLSEIMLQQTRVEAAMLHYKRFLAAVPTVEHLAALDQDALFKLWEGLGYYRRAEHLQKAAKEIMEQWGGQFPQTYEGILSLPGIGEYTAGAISSICFELPRPAVDGNVARILCRMLEEPRPVSSPALRKELAGHLAAVYPKGSCGDFTQSLMELGAIVCPPNGAPKCEKCPCTGFCRAFQNGSQLRFPKKEEKKPRRQEEKTVLILLSGGKIALRRRAKGGLLSGMLELPNWEGRLSENEILSRLPKGSHMLGAQRRRHVFSHIEWDLHGFYIACPVRDAAFFWPDALGETYALPTAFRQFLGKKNLKPYLAMAAQPWGK